MRVKIEAGVIPLHIYGTYLYRYTDTKGIHEIPFVSEFGEKPEIGDFIVEGILVKRDGYQINQDKSKWERRPRKYWDE